MSASDRSRGEDEEGEGDSVHEGTKKSREECARCKVSIYLLVVRPCVVKYSQRE